MCLLLVFYIPQYAYSQGPGSENSSEMVVGNMTAVIKDGELLLPPNQFPYFLLLAFVIIVGITLVVLALIKKGNKGEGKNLGKIRFSDLIRDGDYYPSLPRFQFLIWTFVISFVYLSIYLIRMASGELDAPIVDPNLLILLGVSIASPILGNIISGYKYTSHVSENIERNHDESNINRKSVKTMLFENNKPALFRYQMFLWTFIGVTVFIGLFAVGIYDYIQQYQRCISLGECTEVKALAMPKIDNMLVALMGLSQSGYLGGKAVARTPARISKVVPALNNRFVILGQNFGERKDISSGSVLVNNIVIAGHTDIEVKWFDTKIEFPLPEEHKNKPFKLGINVDDVFSAEYDYF